MQPTVHCCFLHKSFHQPPRNIYLTKPLICKEPRHSLLTFFFSPPLQSHPSGHIKRHHQQQKIVKFAAREAHYQQQKEPRCIIPPLAVVLSCACPMPSTCEFVKHRYFAFQRAHAPTLFQKRSSKYSCASLPQAVLVVSMQL